MHLRGARNKTSSRFDRAARFSFHLILFYSFSTVETNIHTIPRYATNPIWLFASLRFHSAVVCYCTRTQQPTHDQFILIASKLNRIEKKKKVEADLKKRKFIINYFKRIKRRFGFIRRILLFFFYCFIYWLSSFVVKFSKWSRHA